MGDIRTLTIHCGYSAFTGFQMDLEAKIAFIFKVLYSSFANNEADPMNNLNLNRYVVVNTELLILEDELITRYADKEEVEALKTKLNNEAKILRSTLEQLEENEGNNRKGGDSKFAKFDTKLTLLTNI